MKHLILNNRGNSLIGVIIAAAVGVIVMSAVAINMVNQAKSVSFLEDRLSRVGFDRQLKNIFTSPNTCGNTLNGGVVPGLGTERPVNVINDRNNNVIYDLASADPNLKSFDRLNISSMSLLNIDTPLTLGSSGNMKLNVNLARQRNGGGLDAVAPIELDLFVSTDPVTGRISDCSFTGGVTGVLDNKACILSGMRKVRNDTPRTVAGFGYGRSNDITANYVSFTEIFMNGERNIVSMSLVPSTTYCWGSMYNVYKEEYSCTNKVLRRTSRVHQGSAMGPYNDMNCGGGPNG